MITPKTLHQNCNSVVTDSIKHANAQRRSTLYMATKFAVSITLLLLQRMYLKKYTNNIGQA